MLKVEVNQHEGKIMIETQGNLLEIISDLGTVIHSIHVTACNNDIFAGQGFERTFRDQEFLDFIFKPNKADAEILAASETFGKGGSE